MVDEKAFQVWAAALAEEFLQTVVVVDDETSAIDRPASELEPATDVPAGRGVTDDLLEPPPMSEDLPVVRLLNAFADRGLVCGLLAAVEGAQLSERFIRTARRSDLIVLDWVINGKYGDVALDLMARLLEEDKSSGRPRLRAIAIYTGQEGLRTILDEAEKRVADVLPEAETTFHDDGFAFKRGQVHVSIYAKEHVGESEADRGRRTTVEELPGRLISDFARLTEGLVSGVALKSLAALRSDTHRVLQVLAPNIDIGYLGHRMALPDAADAESHVVQMVAAEIWAVLDDVAAGDAAAIAPIRAWLADPTHSAGWTEGTGVNMKSLTESQIDSALAEGLGNPTQLDVVRAMTTPELSTSFMTRVRKEAHRIFSDGKTVADDSNAIFSIRMMNRTRYTGSGRTLQLGTIVRRDGAYQICVQPLCDSVRLPPGSTRGFPFLPLTVVVGDLGPADFIIRDPDTGAHVRLMTKGLPRDISTNAFVASERWVVSAAQENDTFVFEDVERRRFQWIAELKLEFAQKVAIALAQQFARPGVDEPELLRLSR